LNKQQYFFENKYYTENTLKKEFSDEQLNILSTKRLIEKRDSCYKFVFVGVISIGSIVFLVLPKTLNSTSELINPITTIKTLRKYSFNNSQLFDGIDYFNTEPEHPECSELAIAEFLINDFQENGLYTFEEELNELNGNGNIKWDLTINNIDPIFSSKQPLYTDTINKITSDDKNNLTIEIHKWSLQYLSKKYNILLDNRLTSFHFEYYIKLNEIGSSNQLLNHLQKQLKTIYSDRKLQIIKSLIFLIKKKANSLENSLTLYGTKKYENVWESICKKLVNDNFKSNKIFPNPKWNILSKPFTTKGTLIPDILSQDNLTGKFYLFDAKYYSIKYENKLAGIPDYKDILKQFQYQIHIEKKIEKNISNSFLFPINDVDFSNLRNNSKTLFFNHYMAVIGYIEYELFPNKKIWVIMCPFSKWQENYIKNKTLKYNDIFWKT
jgi:hypothetical protein